MKNLEKDKKSKNVVKDKVKKVASNIMKADKKKLAKQNKTDKSNGQNLRPAIFEMLVVIVNRGRGQAVCNYLKSINMNLSIVSFGEGTAPSNLAGLLGYSQEKEVLFSIVNIADSDKVLDLLDSIFLSTEKYSGIAFTVPLKSVTNFTLDTFSDVTNKKEIR